MKTKAKMTVKFGHGRLVADVTIPAGTRVKPTGDGAYFVDDLSFLDPKTQGMTLHDATYYGIRLTADEVENG